MFSKAQHGAGPPGGIGSGRSFGGVKGPEGALRTVKNGPEWSRMVTWRLLGRLAGSREILTGRTESPGTVMRSLGSVSGGPDGS